MSFQQDAERRDFTINAMGVDIDGNVIDYFDGRRDIKNKVLKTVGNPNDRFAEDYIRMLRAVRQASTMGFQIDPETLEAIKINSGNIKDIAPERVTKELLKMANQSGDKFADAIILLDKVGILQHILPEIYKMKYFKQSKEHHPEGDNVFDHVMAVLRQNKLTEPIYNLSILFHDIAKPTTYKKDPDTGKITFLGHADEGIELVKLVADRLKLDKKTKDTLIFTTQNHMKMHGILDMSQKKVLDLVKHKDWKVLHQLAYCDDACRLHLFKPEKWDVVGKYIEEINKKFNNKEMEKNIKKIVNGKRIMDLRKLKPGPDVGRIIAKTLEWIVNKNIDIKDSKKIDEFIKKA